MGSVYKAVEPKMNRTVAIKILHPRLSGRKDLASRFRREARAMSQLSHPNTVRVFLYEELDDGSLCIVMELLEGRSLNQAVRRDGPMPLEKAAPILSQVCGALQEAHTMGIVHRDLKPENILIEKRGFQYFAKLADFGLARPRGAANLPAESNLAGSFLYLAPEVISGQLADTGSDLYALGVILYELVTGRVPFSDFSDERAVLWQHLEEPPAPPSQSRDDVPPALEAIILRLLAKDPKDRFASAGEVLQALAHSRAEAQAAPTRGNLTQVSYDGTGQETDLTQIKSLLETHLLVTWLGADEELALAAAAQLTGQFPDGVWLVDLEAVNDPALVLPATAAVLGVCADPHRALTVSLVTDLREKRLLLVLNHCDRLLEACAQLAETILGACPEVRILAISQHPLNVPAEQYAGQLTGQSGRTPGA